LRKLARENDEDETTTHRRDFGNGFATCRVRGRSQSRIEHA